jgi:hypothetical protein
MRDQIKKTPLVFRLFDLVGVNSDVVGEVGLSRAAGALLPAILDNSMQAHCCLRFSSANPCAVSAPSSPN